MVEKNNCKSDSCVRQDRKLSLRMMLFNCGGLRKHIERILRFMSHREIAVAAICETWYTSDTTPIHPTVKSLAISPANVSVKGRGRGHGGVAMILNPGVDLAVETVATDYSKGLFSIIEVSNVGIGVVYLPPSLSSSVAADKLQECIAALSGYRHAVIVGDLNARNVNFGDVITSSRGRLVEMMLTMGNFIHCKPAGAQQTFVSGDGSSVIDLVFCRGVMVEKVLVEQETALAGGFHLPVVFEIVLPVAYGRSRVQSSQMLRLEQLESQEIKRQLQLAVRLQITQLTEQLMAFRRSLNSEKDTTSSRIANERLNQSFSLNLHEFLFAAGAKVLGLRSLGRGSTTFDESPESRKHEALASKFQKLWSKFEDPKLLEKVSCI